MCNQTKQVTYMAIEKLTDRTIANAKPETSKQWLNDGGGLYLRIRNSGEKSFYFRYRHPTTGQPDWLQLGRYPDMSLAEARVRATKYRALKADGIAPDAHRNNLRRQQQEAERQARLVITVGSLFKQWFENRIQPEFRRPEWLRRDVMGSVLAYEFKLDGKAVIRFEDIPAKEVTRAHVVEIIEATQQRGANALANDQLRYLERMFEYGITKDYLDVSPFAKIEKRAIRKREQARARALSRDELRVIMQTLDSWLLCPLPRHGREAGPTDGMRASWQTQCVITLAIHTAQRTGYICKMEWTEIVGDEWRIPPEKQAKEERRKTAPQTHVVYLPPQAVALLDIIRLITGRGRFVFRSERITAGNEEAPITQASVEQAIGRHLLPLPGQGHRSDKKAAEADIKPLWNMPHFNAHDLRRSVATRMAADVGIQPHIIEKILNHAPSNELAAIYNRATYEKERKSATAAWGKYLDSLKNTCTYIDIP